MLVSFYFFIIPIIIIICFFTAKFIFYKAELKTVGEDFTESKEDKIDNISEATDIVFSYLHNFKLKLRANLYILSHLLLHFFVILLGYISDFTDYLYSISRDFFLKTATKEKHTVSKFWHTLIEYKKEKEEEKGE